MGSDRNRRPGTIWLDADDPEAVTAASAAIDAALAKNPFDRAVHLSEGLYKLTVAPLTVYFSVQSESRIVEVSAIDYTP